MIRGKRVEDVHLKSLTTEERKNLQDAVRTLSTWKHPDSRMPEEQSLQIKIEILKAATSIEYADQFKYWRDNVKTRQTDSLMKALDSCATIWINNESTLRTWLGVGGTTDQKKAIDFVLGEIVREAEKRLDKIEFEKEAKRQAELKGQADINQPRVASPRSVAVAEAVVAPPSPTRPEVVIPEVIQMSPQVEPISAPIPSTPTDISTAPSNVVGSQESKWQVEAGTVMGDIGAGANADLKSARDEIERLKVENQGKDREIGTLKSTNSQLQADLSDRNKQIEGLMDDMAKLQSGIKNTASELQRLKDDLKTAKDALTPKDQSISDLTQNLKTLEQSIKDQEARNSKLSGDIKQLTADKTQLSDDLKKANDALQPKDQRITELETQNQQLVSSKQSAVTSQRQAEETKRDVERQSQEAQKKNDEELARLRTELETAKKALADYLANAQRRRY